MKSEAGFTLLEMLVVLAIIALVSALAAPSILTSENVKRRKFAADAQAALALLPLHAMARKEDIIIPAGRSNVEIGSSYDAIATTASPIVFRLDGSCSEGTAVISAKNIEVAFEVRGPLCHVTRIHR